VIVNRDPAVRGPYTAFADVAGAYERGRPEYPEEAVRWLVGDEPRDVVDLGAGTGKLARALVALGHRVTAVEPLDEMRAELHAVVPDARALAGRAEALPEIARVLRPGGSLALVWNSRDDRDPWMAQLSAIIGNETIEEWDVVPILQEGGLFGPVETARFSFVQVRDRESLLDLVLSRSYCAKLPESEREPVLDAVGRLYDDTAGGEGVQLAYVTECFRTHRSA
jgi:SAM-dependent methyltransferase